MFIKSKANSYVKKKRYINLNLFRIFIVVREIKF